MKTLKRAFLVALVLGYAGSVFAQKDTVIVDTNGAKMYGKIDNQSRKVGKWVLLYPSGEKMAEFNFDKDVPIGNIKIWRKNGHPKEEYSVNAEGEKNGIYRSWSFDDDKNDFELETGQYKNDKQEGHWVTTNSKNVVLEDHYYSDDSPVGEYTRYYPNQQVETHGRYKNGSRDGLWRNYYKNGQVQSEQDYDSRYDKCSVTNYYPNGKIESKGTEKSIRKDGIWFFYDKEGAKTSRQYDNGREGDEVTYYKKDGSIDYVESYLRFVGTTRTYYKNNVKTYYKRYYNTKGKEITELEFKREVEELTRAFIGR
jgi:antitoxin component YwqK of YwqJK toxin-antitoxin module